MSNQTEDSRRLFLKKSAMAASAVVMAAPITAVNAVPVPKIWDETVDVVVIGTGFTGLTAAIEAKEAGANTPLIDKGMFLGGNSLIASGLYNCADPERQKKQNIEDSPDLHYEQTLAGGDFLGDPEKVRYFADHALEGLQWLEKMGGLF